MMPGMEWDAARRTWKPVDYSSLTVEQLAERRKMVDDRAAEVEAQLKGLLPVAQAQDLLNLSMEGLRDLLINLAKQAPDLLSKVI